ncbi:MAG TPA: ABC transporter ATP-binding protein [Kiloniellales bacterium]|nr:ABC transporter ATP-binding protein [Kiloniellales bacterium]
MMLQVENLGKDVGTETHLHDMSFQLTAASLNVLLGPTQAGKTSLLRLLAGLDRPTRGRILLNGEDITERSVRRRSVALVYQQFINYPSLTVFENIASPLRRQRVGGRELDRRVRETATMLGIEALLQRMPDELSGGQQQRTALARALVREADLLLVDEPLVNLDYKLREQLRDELKSIFAARGSIVVYTTTEPLEALMLGGSIQVLNAGRLLQSGPTIEVYQRPATVEVGRVFSDPPINLLPGQIGADAARIGEVTLPLSGYLRGIPEGDYQFGVRASHLSVDDSRRRSAAAVPLEAIVELAEISGSETFIHLRHGPTSFVVQEEGVASFALGEKLRIWVDPDRLYVFQPEGALVAAPEFRGIMT